jgi:hypothetical protein
MDDMGIAVLRTIDKLSARTDTFEIPVDKTVKFGSSLFIKVRACRKSTALDRPESAAFLQIWEKKPKQDQSTWVFSGWMFASSPSISGIEHPVYDVWVIACKNKGADKKDEAFSTETAPAVNPATSTTIDSATSPTKTQPQTPAEHTPDPSPAGQAPAAPVEEQRLSPAQINALPSFEDESSNDGENAVATPDTPDPKE